jgi:hypothetical protein
MLAKHALSQLSYTPSGFAANQYIFQQPLGQRWVNERNQTASFSAVALRDSWLKCQNNFLVHAVFLHL